MKLTLADYMKIAIWWGRFGVGNKQLFCSWVGFSSHPQGFLQTFEWRGRGVNTCWGQQARLKEGNISVKIGNAGGIIKGDNSAGHWFALPNIISMSFFK